MRSIAATEAGARDQEAAELAFPALVVFADDSSLKWLRPLRSGFRHCFIALKRNDVWIICNPLSHYTDLDVAIGWTLGELSAWYRRHGFVVVETIASIPPKRCAPIRPFTCVEMVKRILGLRAPWVFTPWQLYRHLIAASRRDSVRSANRVLTLILIMVLFPLSAAPRASIAYPCPCPYVPDQEDSPMGGLFHSPKPKPAQTTPVVTPIAASTSSTATAVSQPEESAQKERIESVKRQARGRAATIVTSPRGLLTLSPTEPTRKSLLGE